MLKSTILIQIVLAVVALADGSPTLPPDLIGLFNQGEAALRRGDLPAAETAFKQVLAKDPDAVGAWANLGVVSMRQSHWDDALADFRTAEKLAPTVPGIRLNIGLVYYRQSHFRDAIEPLSTVVRDVPSSAQAQYLLGLCYFLTEQYAAAVPHLDQVWEQQSSNLAYLYTVVIAAGKAGNHDLENRAMTRMIEVGRDSAEMHLFIGKALVQRNELDKAWEEFTRAEQMNSRLPFVHYYLGGIARRRNDLPRAKAELLKEAGIDPDVAFNYDELGAVEYLLQDNAGAEHAYLKAVQLDPTLATGWYGLARIYQDEQRYPEALKVVDSALALDTNSASAHFLRGQVLMRLGRREQAAKDLAEGQRLAQLKQDRLAKEAAGKSVRDPQAAPAQ